MARRLDDGDARRSVRRRAGPRAPAAADGVAEQLRRGSTAARARAALRLAVRPRSGPSRRSQQMREEAPRVSHVSGERIGGGLAADGLGELSKLLLGSHPAKALRLARDTGVLVELLPEFEPAIGFEQESRYHDMTVDEHTFAVVQAAADAVTPLRVRLAALFHDAASRRSRGAARTTGCTTTRSPATRRKSHEQVSARARRRGARAAALSDRAAPARRAHRARATCSTRARRDALRARQAAGALRRRADVRPARPQARPTCSARGRPTAGRPRAAARVPRGASSSEQGSPHRLRDLAVAGDDLIALGYKPGPGDRPHARRRSWTRSCATRA